MMVALIVSLDRAGNEVQVKCPVIPKESPPLALYHLHRVIGRSGEIQISRRDGFRPWWHIRNTKFLCIDVCLLPIAL